MYDLFKYIFCYEMEINQRHFVFKMLTIKLNFLDKSVIYYLFIYLIK